MSLQLVDLLRTCGREYSLDLPSKLRAAYGDLERFFLGVLLFDSVRARRHLTWLLQ